MSKGDALTFHQDQAEQMIVEVQSWNESAGANLDELGPLASAAVSPVMLTSHLATAAAENRTQIVDILPAINDQDSNRSPEGNVLRFALHRQGQNSQVSTHCHSMPCRGSLQLPNSVGLGYRLTGLNVQPSTDRRKGFLPALGDRVSTLEVR